MPLVEELLFAAGSLVAVPVTCNGPVAGWLSVLALPLAVATPLLPLCWNVAPWTLDWLGVPNIAALFVVVCALSARTGVAVNNRALNTRTSVRWTIWVVFVDVFIAGNYG